MVVNPADQAPETNRQGPRGLLHASMVANLLLLIIAGGFGAAWGLAARERQRPSIARLTGEMGVFAWRATVGSQPRRYGVSLVREDISGAVDANEQVELWRYRRPEPFDAATLAAAGRSLELPALEAEGGAKELGISLVELGGAGQAVDSLRVSLSWKDGEGMIDRWPLAGDTQRVASSVAAPDPQWGEEGCAKLWTMLGSDEAGRPSAWHVVLWRLDR